ncbi:sigma-70 family RNA polymerase sigma factor [Planctomycetota bacterium]
MKSNQTSQNGRAFEILVRQHHRRLLAYAGSLNSDPVLAEDLVQEAFITAYRKLAAFDPSRDFGAWVRGIIRNKYREWARKRKEPVLDDQVLAGIEEQHNAWDRAEEDGRGEALEALRECIAQLQDGLRRIVEAFYFRGDTCPLIAAATDSSEAAIRKRLERSRGLLADCVDRKLGAGQ